MLTMISEVHWLVWVSVALSIVLYVVLIRQIIKSTTKQSFATWSLWTMLDVIALVTTLMQEGNFLILVIYVIGGTVISLIILRWQGFSWEPFDLVVLALVIICMCVWTVSGPYGTTITSTVAVFIAGFPLMKMAFQKPHEQNLFIWTGFTIANALATAGGKEWSVPERFYPAVCTLLTGILLLGALQKLWRKAPPLAPLARVA